MNTRHVKGRAGNLLLVVQWAVLGGIAFNLAGIAQEFLSEGEFGGLQGVIVRTIIGALAGMAIGALAEISSRIRRSTEASSGLNDRPAVNVRQRAGNRTPVTRTF
jgi:hypothetical protein